MESETLEDKEDSVGEEGAPEKGKGESEIAEEEVSSEKEEEDKEENGDKQEEENEEGNSKKVESSRKRGRKKEDAKKNEGEESVEKKMRKRSSSSKEPATPVERIQRPARERKSVERYSASSVEKIPVSKGLKIQKGPGTQLKEIPNVAFKLSKRKADENLQILHMILFGKRSKVFHLKKNIFQFSGFVWDENEERQRARIKEKLDKCVKDKLLDFCDVLDIPVNKATTKKEELSAKLLEFLESPHATTEVFFAEKKSKKRKRRAKGIRETTVGGETVYKSAKKTKKSNESMEAKKVGKDSSKTKRKIECEDGDEPGTTKSDASDDVSDDDDPVQEEESESNDEENEPEKHVESKKGSGMKQTKKGSSTKTKEKAIPVKKGPSTKSGRSSKSPLRESDCSDADDGDSAKEDENDAGTSESEEEEDKPNVEIKKASPKKQMKGSAPKAKAIATIEKKYTPAKSIKSTSRSGSKKGISDDATHSPAAISKSRGSSSKTQKSEKNKGQETQKVAFEEKKMSKSGQVVAGKDQGKGKASRKPMAEPTKEEIHAAAANILKEVDFNTATLSDILKLLGTHFKMDLMQRKAEVKDIIEEVINNMTDDEGDEAEEDAEEADEGA